MKSPNKDTIMKTTVLYYIRPPLNPRVSGFPWRSDASVEKYIKNACKIRQNMLY